MGVVVVLVGVALAVAGLFYLILGRNRYGMVARNRKQLTAGLGAGEAAALKPEPCRIIRIYFIKPSRYDDEGYLQFFRWGVQPANTLTVLAALNDSFNKHYASKRNVG